MTLHHGFDDEFDGHEECDDPVRIEEPLGSALTESVVVVARENEDHRDEPEVVVWVEELEEHAEDEADEVGLPVAEHQDSTIVVTNTTPHHGHDQRNADSLSVGMIEDIVECDADCQRLCDMAFAELAARRTTSTKAPKNQIDALQQASLYRREPLARMDSEASATLASRIATRYSGSVKSKNGKPLGGMTEIKPSHKPVATPDEGRDRTDGTSLGGVVITDYLQQLATQYPGRGEYTQEQIASVFTEFSNQDGGIRPAQPRETKANRHKFRLAMKYWHDFDA